MKPLAIELYAGLHGWGEGLVAEGFRVLAFDVVDMCELLGQPRPEDCELILQDVLTLHGSQFRDAAVIVASPPCQAYSYRAMPWKRAKALPPPDNSLFEACFRIQREASESAGRHIPLIVENVRGAQKWVGRARWHFGSYFLWGDVPALMPIACAVKIGGVRGDDWFAHHNTAEFSARANGVKAPHRLYLRDGESHTRHLTNPHEHIKNNGGSWFSVAHNTTSGLKQNPVSGLKVGKAWFGSYAEQKASGTISPGRMHNSHSAKRKAASAMIAKIPFPLAQHIARCFKPAYAEGCA